MLERIEKTLGLIDKAFASPSPLFKHDPIYSTKSSQVIVGTIEEFCGLIEKLIAEGTTQIGTSSAHIEEELADKKPSTLKDSIFTEQNWNRLRIYVLDRVNPTAAIKVLEDIKKWRKDLLDGRHPLLLSRMLQHIYFGSRFLMLDLVGSFKFRLQDLPPEAQKFIKKIYDELEEMLMREIDFLIPYRPPSTEGTTEGLCALHTAIEALRVLELKGKQLRGRKNDVKLFKELMELEYTELHRNVKNVKKMLSLYGNHYDQESGENGFEVLLALLVKVCGSRTRKRVIKIFPDVATVESVASTAEKRFNNTNPYQHLMISSIKPFERVLASLKIGNVIYVLKGVGQTVPDHIFLVVPKQPIGKGPLIDAEKIDAPVLKEKIKLDLGRPISSDYLLYTNAP